MKTPSTLLVAIIVCGLILSSFHLSVAQTGTQVSGIINQNTTWTKANSPYALTGNVLIRNGVTLAIEAGTTVNLNEFYIEVNGTLKAKGTATSKISFNKGSIVYGNPIFSITFTEFSSSYDEQNGKGSIVQNAILNPASILIESASPKIDNNSIDGIIRTAGAGNTLITNNNISGGIEDGSAAYTIIINNTVTYGTHFSQVNGFPVVYGLFSRNHNNINASNNVISGISVGMDLGYTKGMVSDNVISNCKTGIVTSGDSSPIVQRNLIVGSNLYGMAIQTSATIAQYNTITEGTIGIYYGLGSLNAYVFGDLPTITNNNIYANNEYNFYSKAGNNITVIDNYWGTTDPQAINQSIYDFKNDFNLGNVTFIPFLTAPNPNAPEISSTSPSPSQSEEPSSSASTPSPMPYPSATPEPSVPEFPSWIIFPLIIASTIAVSVYFRKKKQHHRLFPFLTLVVLAVKRTRNKKL